MDSTQNRNLLYELPISDPAAQQVDAKLLSAAKEAASQLPNLLAYLVVRNGFIVDEHYARSRTAAVKSHIRSVTKSVTATLVGIAIAQGYIENLDVPILHYFPEYSASDHDERKSHITLKHLVTMTAGFAWDELTFDPEKSAIIGDWFFGGKRAALYDALERPLAHEAAQPQVGLDQRRHLDHGAAAVELTFRNQVHRVIARRQRPDPQFGRGQGNWSARVLESRKSGKYCGHFCPQHAPTAQRLRVAFTIW